jgi:hypothetical protein
MSRQTEFYPVKDQSMGATFVTPWFETRFALALKLHLSITGSPVGSITFEGSNDPKITSERWSDPSAVSSAAAVVLTTSVAGEGVTVTSGAIATTVAVQGMVTVTQAPLWVRVRYTRTSGTGVLNVWAFGRD